MLTLTVKNVDACDLANEITLMNAAWHRMLKIKAWQKTVIGSMRSMEVTHNLSSAGVAYDTYHPHYHCLLCVKKSYFTSRDYTTKKGWQQLWKDAARLEYDPQIWVTKVKGDNSAAALAEVAKYASKPGDYIIPHDLEMMAQSVRVLDAALHKRRLVAWTGNLKKIHTKLGLDDAEEGDLINTDNNEDLGAETETLVSYDWVAAHRQYYKEMDKYE